MLSEATSGIGEVPDDLGLVEKRYARLHQRLLDLLEKLVGH